LFLSGPPVDDVCRFVFPSQGLYEEADIHFNAVELGVATANCPGEDSEYHAALTFTSNPTVTYLDRLEGAPGPCTDRKLITSSPHGEPVPRQPLEWREDVFSLGFYHVGCSATRAPTPDPTPAKTWAPTAGGAEGETRIDDPEARRAVNEVGGGAAYALAGIFVAGMGLCIAASGNRAERRVPEFVNGAPWFPIHRLVAQRPPDPQVILQQSLELARQDMERAEPEHPSPQSA
jgi:hypothetical protein